MRGIELQNGQKITLTQLSQEEYLKRPDHKIS
jgi:hypothetical protein